MNSGRRALVYGLPALIVGVIWWFTSWTADAGAVESSIERRDAAVQANTQAIRQLRVATVFRDGGAASVGELESLRRSLPESAQLGQFVLLNDAAARDAGVVVSDLSPSAPGTVQEVGPRGTQPVGIDMVVVGSQDSLDAYLAQLKLLPRSISVDDLSTSKASDSTSELTIHARIFQLGDPPKPTR